MRVCHIVSGDLWAGAESMVLSLLKTLACRANDICLHAVVMNQGQLSRSIQELGIPSLVLDEKKLSFVEICSKVERLIRHLQPSIVHSHRYKENLVACLGSLRQRRTRLVATQHGMPELYGDGSCGLTARCKASLHFRLLSMTFDRVVAVSNEMQGSLVSTYRFSPTQVEVIRNGIVVPPVEEIKADSLSFVIGSAGRLSPVKDYAFLIEIAREVRKQTKGVVFELAGQGPQRSELDAILREYHLQDSFRMKGFVRDISGFYRGLQVYVNTSLHEGIPLSVLEAMAYGLPIIAPKVGGLEEIIQDGSEGYLLPSRDPAAFAQKCMALYENKSLRDRMSFAAREKVCAKFSAEAMASEYLALYRELLEARRERSRPVLRLP